MKNLIILFIGMFAFLATSCSPGYTVVKSTAYDPSVLVAGKKFAFIESEGKLPDGLSESDYQIICEAIAAQLTARGFIADNNADLLLKIGLTGKSETSTKNTVPDWSLFWIGPAASIYRSYYDNAQTIGNTPNKGYILMDVIDTNTDKVAYDAAVNGNIGEGNLLKNIRNPASMEKVAIGLLKTFPVEAPKK